MSILRLSFSVTAALALTGMAAAFDPSCHGCATQTGCSTSWNAKHPKYIYKFCNGCRHQAKPPYVHPGVPFGYYPTSWRPWPYDSWAGGAPAGAPFTPPLMDRPPSPYAPDIETLPPPRPADTRARPSNQVIINPAVHRR